MTTQKEMLARYKQAEKFFGNNSSKLISRTNTVYTWNKDETKIVYKHNLYDDQKEYTFVDILKGKQEVVFDHLIILEEINKNLEKKAEVLDLTITDLTEEDDIIASINGSRFKISLDNEVEKLENLPINEEPKVGTSPDGKWLAFVKEENLFIQDIETKEETQLTFDGVKENGYGRALPDPREMIKEGKEDYDQDIVVQWSPNSKYFITEKLDYRDRGTILSIIQSTPPDGGKPKLFNQVQPCTGDERLPLGYVVLVDIDKKKCKVFDKDPIESRQWGPGADIWMMPWFSKENNKYYYVHEGRGLYFQKFIEIDLISGESRVIFEKTSERKLLEAEFNNAFTILYKSDKVLNICDRDGWPHLYMYDLITGEMERQITNGKYGIKEIEHVDEINGVIYFTAFGREDCNPYYEMLYSINFDGTNLQLLTQEKQFHQIKFSPSKKYFIDVQSIVTQPEKYFLRKSSTGEKVLELKELDITRLLDSGWTPVEEFVAKARDGKTDIYCNIHRPSNFDPNKKHPVIESIYTGPFCFTVPKTFIRALTDYYRQNIAELGFIVVVIDGLGTKGRGNEFNDYSYKKVQDSGLPDHITALKQMAKKYPYMDLDRVALYGQSLGGYDAVNAMLRYPEFYKVGVAVSGVYDLTLDKSSALETMTGAGFPMKDYFDILSKTDKLEGKLLLVHGEIDEHVNPVNTMRLVKAFIDANKDFDMLIGPNEDHGILGNKYFQRKMWDYFVSHLLGETPPKEYNIGE